MQGKTQLNASFQLPKAFTDKFHTLNPEKAEKYWLKYLYVMRKALLRRIPYLQTDYTFVSLKKLLDDCGRFYINNQVYYIYNEFVKIYPFFAVVENEKGSNIKKAKNPFEKNSKIYFMNQHLIDQLIDTCNINELVETIYGDISDKNIKFVTIDIKSLTNFINTTQYNIDSIDKNKKPEYYQQLLRNLRQGKYIKMISEFFYDGMEYRLPLIEKPSPYGRMYYEGINLQNVSKEVRIAAIGSHTQYDINAAVYAIKLMYAMDILREHNIDHTGCFTYTKEYLDNKNKIRSRLAKHITAYNDPEKLVKQAITALGFGARMGGGSWKVDDVWHSSSINDIIMNVEDRQRFLNDPWIIEFKKEQHKMTSLITTYFLSLPNWKKHHLSILPRIANEHGKIHKTQVMSYLFQKAERLIMDTITKNIDDVYLIIHDSFIMLDSINGMDLVDIREKLQAINPYLTLTIEYNNGWLNKEIMDYEIEHKKFIEREERLANNGILPTRYTLFKNKVYNQTDNKCYDGYDTGERYEEYDVERDEYVKDMTLQERNEHYRIVGYTPNKYPDFINKLMRNKL